MNIRKMQLDNILINLGFATRKQLDILLNIQNNEGGLLEELLVEKGYITKKQLIDIHKIQLEIPFIDLNKCFIDPNSVKQISENLARKHLLIPIKKSLGKLTVAMADPLNLIAIDDVSLATGLDINIVMAKKDEILFAINKYFDSREVAEQAMEEFAIQHVSDKMAHNDYQTQDSINNAPVVKFMNAIINQAVRRKASDIHIEPFEHYIRIRFRIDGDLAEIMRPCKTTHPAIVTRIKIISKLDISEKRIPQDGRVEIIVDDRPIDMRVSILPTIYGEKIVMRLLDKNNIIANKEELGFSQKDLQLLNKIIKNPMGITLVTGPTGSGKTTTLYSLLKELNRTKQNIITIEDPIEYSIDGISQVQVNLKTGLNFATGLRSILRQDPDIIMVGEIRDKETAQIAVRAAITGHLVLSTLHTNDTVSAISRLIDMEIDSYLLSSAIICIIAQRLVKKICTHCKTQYSASSDDLFLLYAKQKPHADNVILYKGSGCNACNNTGYSGRTAIHEIMVLNRKIRNLINSNVHNDMIKDKAIESGMSTLFEACKTLVLEGVTTVDELLRVCFTIDKY